MGTVLLALNSLVLLFSTEVLSDIPFVAVVIAIFLLLDQADAGGLSTGKGVALVVFLAVAVLLREIGAAIVGAAVVTLVIRRNPGWAAGALLLPLAVYLLWWYRNEILIATIEMPPLTNAKLFTSHFFTPADASLFSELLARLTANARRYGMVASGLMFFPVYATPQFDVVSRAGGAVPFVLEALTWGKYLLGILAGGLALPGILLDLRNGGAAIARVLFLLLYVAIVLLYPINDVRFLLPLLVLSILYASLTLGEINRRVHSRLMRGVVYGVVILALIPIVVWNWSYVSNSISYKQSPVAFFQRVGTGSQYPSHFAKPLPLAGRWLRENTGAQSVMLSQWKDLATSLGGRKLLNVDQTIPSEEFDALIRDYRVQYVVAVRQKNGLREFEFQMSQSRRFSFRPVHSVAAIEIYAVGPAGEFPQNRDTPFARAFNSLGSGRYQDAVVILDSLRRRDSLNLGSMFYSAVANECSGNLGPARQLFSAIASFPQAGMFLEQARQHLIAVADMEQGASVATLAGRSDHLMKAGLRLWNLGVKKKGTDLIYGAAADDSSHLPSIVLATLFAIEEGNLPVARNGIARIAFAPPGFTQARLVVALATQIDSLRWDTTPSRRSMRFVRIGSTYEGIGFIERAIDLYRQAIAEDPGNVVAYRSLFALYERKRRIEPAFMVIRDLVKIDGSDGPLREKEAALRARFE
jgi:tetratricopeptide (TPR) repeat protein